jgi:hypothetical protein
VFSRTHAWLLKLSLFLVIPCYYYYSVPTLFGDPLPYYKNKMESIVFSLIVSFFILGCILEPIDLIDIVSKSKFFNFWQRLSYSHFMTHFYLFTVIYDEFKWVYSIFPVNIFGLVFNSLILICLPIPLSILVNKYVEEPAVKLEGRFLKEYNARRFKRIVWRLYNCTFILNTSIYSSLL